MRRHPDPGDLARRYQTDVLARFGERHGRIRPGPSSWLPERWRGPLVGRLLANTRFARDVMVGRWFLHRAQPALRLSA